MLGALLVVGEQAARVLGVGLRRRAARAGAGDRVGHDAPALDLDQRLGAGPDDVVGSAVRQGQSKQVHVRAGVGGAQHPVDVEGVDRAVDLVALRGHHLEDVAGADRLLGTFDVRLVAARGQLWARPRDRQVHHRDGAVGAGRQLGAHPVQARDGVGPRLVHPLVGVVVVHRVRHQQQGPVGMVEYRQVGSQHHRQLGQPQVVDGVVGQALPPANHVVGHRTDHAAGQRRQPTDRIGA